MRLPYLSILPALRELANFCVALWTKLVTPTLLDVLGGVFRRVLPIEIFLQDYRSGHGVHGARGVALTFFVGTGGGAQNPAPLLFEQPFGLPACQALIDQFHRQAELFVDARRKSTGFLGHVALRTIKAKRQANNDLPHAMLARSEERRVGKEGVVRES